jgi:hypothetical protein
MCNVVSGLSLLVVFFLNYLERWCRYRLIHSWWGGPGDRREGMAKSGKWVSASVSPFSPRQALRVYRTLILV